MGIKLRTTDFVSRLCLNQNVLISKRLLAVCKVNISQSNYLLSEQTLRICRKTNTRTCRHKFLTAYKSYLSGSEKETIHKHYTAAESEGVGHC